MEETGEEEAHFTLDTWRAEADKAETAFRRGSEGESKVEEANDAEVVAEEAVGGKRKLSSFFDHGTLNRFQETLGRNVPKAQTYVMK